MFSPVLQLSGGFDWNSSNNEDVPTDERAAADSDDDDASEVGENAQVITAQLLPILCIQRLWNCLNTLRNVCIME